MAASPPARPGALRRFGPIAVVVVAIVLVAVLATTKGQPADSDAATGGGGNGSGTTSAADDPAQNPDLPPTLQEVEQAAAADDDAPEMTDFEWGEGCDLITGRVKLPSVYAPPCVPVHEGDNGGATSPGVTADTIKIVVYRAPPGSDITAALAGLLDDEEVQQETRLAYLEMLADVYETYGRELDVEVLVGSGAADDEAAAVADARKVSDEIKPFAVIGGPALTHAFATALARSRILCIGCGLSVPDSVYQENAPFLWGTQPTPEQFLRNLGDYIVRRLFQRPAEYAGPELQDQERVFGTINFEQDPPVFSSVSDQVNERGDLRGYEAKVRETYILDIPKLPERAASIIARMKAEGVTTIIFLGDPIMPSYLAASATAEGYYPEWIVTGTVLTDTTSLGRTYDATQWEHAFGLSNLAGRRPIAEQEQWRLFEWYYGTEPEATLTSGVIYPTVALLMLGIHMAGPNLTPETFEGGMFKYPPSGGGPTAPQISYGDHGLFPNPDYLGVDDVAEIWWDAEATGPDEQGKSEKAGMYRYANGGIRILPGRMQSGPPAPHDPATSPALFVELPPQDQYPEYPPPEGSPAAGG